MSKIFIPTTKPEDWQRLLAEPDKHWRTGYSAKALAYCWQEAQDDFPTSVRRTFRNSGLPLFQNIELLFAFPEYKVPLPPPGGRPSQNDLFVIAKGDGQLISMTVEGKVSEEFGALVSDWRKGASAGKKTRLSFLCNQLALDVNAVLDLRYQLLHRTVSAILEAKKLGARNALMLVHSFSQANEWFKDYAKFASLFGITANPDAVYLAGNIRGIDLYLGWVRGEKKYLRK